VLGSSLILLKIPSVLDLLKFRNQRTSGSQIFYSLRSKRTSDSELLKNFKEVLVLMNESGGKELAV
jgi:hypothetical protein